MMDLDPESRRILELARVARTPNEGDKARLEQRLSVGLGLSITASTSAAAAETAKSLAASKTAGGLLALKWWIGGGVLAAIAVASYAKLSSPAPQKRAPVIQTAHVAAPVIAATAPSKAETPAASGVEQPPAAPVPEHAARRVEQRRPAATSDSLASELELLQRAQSAWRGGDPKLALSLLDQHRANYPRSALAIERDALKVLTLCDLGRQADATRGARSLLARAPHSPLRASIEQSCALK